MKILRNSNVSLALLTLSLLASCGAPGPVNHVNFNEEFSDTANVKSTPQDYGFLQEKEYRDVVHIEKTYTPEATLVNDLHKNAVTSAPPDAKSKKYTLDLSVDPEAKFVGADSLLNEKEQETPLTSKLKSCLKIKIATTINGIHVEYTAGAPWWYRSLTNFESYKISCEDEVKKILSQLSSDSKLKFSYLHLPANGSVRTNPEGVKLVEKTLAHTRILRRLYQINPEFITVEFTKFEDAMKIARVEEENKAKLEERAPETPSGRFVFTLDQNPPQLSDLSLQLNGIKKEKAKDWKQGVYDPLSGVIQNAFMPLIFLPAEMALQAFLRPLGAKPNANGLFISHFDFEECRNIYVDTSLSGVEVKLDAPQSEEQGAACENELLKFFAKERALKFDYIEAAPIVESVEAEAAPATP